MPNLHKQQIIVLFDFATVCYLAIATLKGSVAYDVIPAKDRRQICTYCMKQTETDNCFVKVTTVLLRNANLLRRVTRYSM